MILEYSVTNYKSFKETQTFSMLASKAYKEFEETNTYMVDERNLRALTSSAIYGPNASGKSNLFESVFIMKRMVLDSAKDSSVFNFNPFRLSEEFSDSPTQFEVLFLHEGVQYQFGFSADEKRIHDEWLIAYPKNRAQLWYSRSYDEELGDYEWAFGGKLLGEKNTWKKSTKETSLFFSTAVLLNSNQLKKVEDWFKHGLRFIGVEGVPPGFSAGYCLEGNEELVLNFLKSADLGIEGIKVEEKELNDLDDFVKTFPENVRDNLRTQIKNRDGFDITTIHTGQDGNKIEFDLHEESIGTARLFNLAGPWIDALKFGRVLLIDELNNSLHPHMVSFLVNLFNNPRINKKGAQLIFTTHETSLLSAGHLRRDQIWFCEKKSDMATELYSLEDFKARKGKVDLEKAYLSGKYSAVPYLDSQKIEALLHA